MPAATCTTPSALAALKQSVSLDASTCSQILEIRERSTHSHSIYEQRLMRHYEKVLKMLREVQAERKVQEAREQEAIYEVGMCHLVAGKEFSPAEFGFVCSKAEAESLVKRK